MNALPTIPTPPAQRWLDFRIRGIPILIFLLVLLLAYSNWDANMVPSNILGEVQGVNANVASLDAGLLKELNVAQFDAVTEGQPLAVVVSISPETVKASLAAIRGDLLVLRARMMQDQQRNNLNYQQFRMDLLLREIELETAKILLRQAESELQRVVKLYRDKILPEGVAPDGKGGYEVALRDRDALALEVAEKTRLVSTLRESSEPLSAAAAQDGESAINEAIDAAISAKEDELRRTTDSKTLRSPIDGVVSIIYRNQGENIAAGEPLIVISAANAEHILGFIRQPIQNVPRVGDPIEVRTRGVRKQKAITRVEKVGPRLELFTQPLRLRGFDSSQERGLPILVKLPDGMQVHPGEIVDLFLRRQVN